jgi:hypothetical protein
MNLSAFRQETFPAALATSRESGAPAFCAHARAKTVLIFSGALRALQGAFHDVAFSRGATLGRQAALSIPAHDLDPAPDPGRVAGALRKDPEHDQDHEQERAGAHPHCADLRFME